MTIVVKPYSDPQRWMAALGQVLADDRLLLWPETGDPGEVDFVIAGRMNGEDLARFTNLRAVLSLAAGAEQWQGDDIPDVPVVRLNDPAMSDEMAAFALHWVLHFQRGFDRLAALQRDHRFEQPDYTEAADYRVGILGHGSIGARVGEAFTDLGYPVNAWSRSGGDDTPSVTHYAGTGAGNRGLDAFLADSHAIINVLPSTAETTHLLSRQRLARCKPEAVFVNMGRGTVVDETDLLAALDRGELRAAVLDVTDPEPPDPSSPLFDHPAVVLTGHSAGSTLVTSASRLIADNIARIRAGAEPFPLLDRQRGY